MTSDPVATFHTPEFGHKKPVLFIEGDPQYVKQFPTIPDMGDHVDDALIKWEEWCRDKDVEFEVILGPNE